MKYKCYQYEYSATWQSNLKVHIHLVYEELKYNCSQCDYKATTQGNFTNHVKSIHEGVKYYCGQCDYKTTQKASITHLTYIHLMINCLNISIINRKAPCRTFLEDK